MALIDELVTLNPYYESIPVPLRDALFDVARRVANILGDRDLHELTRLQQTLEHIQQHHQEELHDLILDIWATYGDSAISRFSPVRELFLCRPVIDIQQFDDGIGPTWAELFALLALRRFEHFLRQASAVQKNESEADKPWPWPPAAYLAYGDAIEAITLAESMTGDPDHQTQLLQELERRLAAKKKEQARNAAIDRHAKTNALLGELVEFYRAGDFPSYAAAVDAFLRITPEERYRHLAPTNRARTLREGLSAIIRGKRTLQ